jgi:hypothetical protein
VALKIRAITPSDIALVRKLHEQYYRQFEFPPFANSLNAFVIEDEKNEIVMAGSVEMVAEAMLITNKAKSEIKIGKALVEAQKCSAYTCAVHKIRDLYAFVDNDVYAQHLIQHGFHDSGRALKLRIPPNGKIE